MSTILVLDDDPMMLTSLCDVLQSAGYKVIPAASAVEAFDKAERSKFQLIVADVRMDGIDGIQCIEQLLDRYPRIKSIVITGYASDDAPGRAMEAESCDYLRKPFETEQLLQSVSRALAASKESKSYRELLDHYWGQARAAVQKVGVAVTGMEKSRDKAFRWYYLGVRSGHIGSVAALSVWEILEAAERQRVEAEKAKDLLSKAKELKQHYDHMGEFCKQPTMASASGVRRKEGAGRQHQFQPLFKNIRDGKISCEQLKLAVYLQSLSNDELNTSPELAELKRQIWG